MFIRRMMMGAVLASLGLNAAARGDGPLKVEKEDGHISPVSVEVIYKKSETTKVTGLASGSSDFSDGNFRLSHQMVFDEDGKASGCLWIDTIASISETEDDGALITFKDRSQKRIRYSKSKYLVLMTADGGRAAVDLEEVKEVRFLKPARKDSANNAMFDQWKFSPFTGEKLRPND